MGAKPSALGDAECPVHGSLAGHAYDRLGSRAAVLSRITAHPHLTLTMLYNALEKLRSGIALTDAERDIHDAGQISILRHLHDRLDEAVAAAYGWPADLPATEIVARIVALNAQRRAEEAEGLVRWLRPDFQRPRNPAAPPPNPPSASRNPKRPTPSNGHATTPRANSSRSAPRLPAAPRPRPRATLPAASKAPPEPPRSTRCSACWSHSAKPGRPPRPLHRLNETADCRRTSVASHAGHPIACHSLLSRKEEAFTTDKTRRFTPNTQMVRWGAQTAGHLGPSACFA